MTDHPDVQNFKQVLSRIVVLESILQNLVNSVCPEEERERIKELVSSPVPESASDADKYLHEALESFVRGLK